ncbi:MAG TPA: sodium:solute symporter [Bryobacteraceae bacterium]|nr:sodium:solute symporter [Bryobacteraceae bacterium]
MRWLDLAVIGVYLAGITWFGVQFRSSQKSLKDYFLGGRTAPWWAIALSIVSAETSTLTVIGAPALAFQGNFAFLQLVLGYLLARVVIATLFLPAYFRGELFTAYELIRVRFGERARKLTAAMFLVLRALAEGVRVFAISIVISILLGTGQVGSIAVILCLTLIYTYEGGMTAVIWTDVVQMGLYIAGAAFSLIAILSHIPGGWAHVVAIGARFGKFQIFDFRLGAPSEFFSRSYSFWAGILGGCFLTTASHGAEQLMVQRLLAARSQAQSRGALFASWLVVAAQFTLFLFIGACLFTFYSDRHLPAPAVPDSIYPQFVWSYLPSGAAGLIMAAILAAAMSNLSAALNSLASTTVVDFLRPFAPGGVSERMWVLVARFATVFWALTLFALALLARRWGGVLQAGLSIASVLYGSLLGVFLLGILTRRIRESSAIAGMIAGLAVMIYVRFATPIAFTWYVLIGTAATFAVGVMASWVFDRPCSRTRRW